MDNKKTEKNTLQVKIKLHDDLAVIPKYAKNGDAGLDLTATKIISEDRKQITYDTGVSLEIPYGYVGLVFPRSSIRKYDLTLSNSVGVIDSGYRGKIMATFNKKNNYFGLLNLVRKIFKLEPKDEKYAIGERIVQIIIIPYPQIEFKNVTKLSESERGTGGFGSTGNKKIKK